MGLGLEGSVLRVLDKVVVVEILDTEPLLQSGVGGRCLKGLGRVSKIPGTSEYHRFDRLLDRLVEDRSRQLSDTGPSDVTSYRK